LRVKQDVISDLKGLSLEKSAIEHSFQVLSQARANLDSELGVAKFSASSSLITQISHSILNHLKDGKTSVAHASAIEEPSCVGVAMSDKLIKKSSLTDFVENKKKKRNSDNRKKTPNFRGTHPKPANPKKMMLQNVQIANPLSNILAKINHQKENQPCN